VGFQTKGYDPAERAFVLTRMSGSASQVQMMLGASENSPLFNPAILIKNWNADAARVRANDRPLASEQARIGTVRTLDGTDLVVYLQLQSTKPMEITLTPN
jgi:hypothetical protein